MKASAAGTLMVALAACGVQSSAPFSGTQTGDVTVARTGDLAGITKLSGNLTVHPAAGTTILTLPDLTAVTGSVTIEGLDGTYKTGFTLSLPALTSAGLDVVVQQTGSAVTLDIPALTAISGHLIFDQTSPVSISAAALTSIHGDWRVTDGGLGTISLPALKSIDGGVNLLRYQGVGTAPISISLPVLTTITGDVQLSSGAMTTLDWPLLTSAGGLEVIDVSVQLKLPSLASLDGSLRAERSTLTATELGALNDVDEDVDFDGDSLEATDGISLPALARVGGALTIQNISSLVTLSLPALTEVDTAVSITDDAQLEHVTFDVLAKLNSDFTLSGCGGPVDLDLPSLVSAGGSILMIDNGEAALSAPLLAQITGSLTITGSTLDALSLPALSMVGQNVDLEQLSAMTPQPLSLNGLASVGGDVIFEESIGFSVLSLPLLSTIGSSPGGFARGNLIVEDNDSLTALILTGLHNVVLGVKIENNPLLHSAEMDVLTVAIGGTKTICGNSDDAACVVTTP